ncbi:unnamed protein product, partial [Staurois parvus]
MLTHAQGRTENSWGPPAIGDHGAPVSLPKLKKAYEKGTRGISWGPLLTQCPSFQMVKWSVRPWLEPSRSEDYNPAHQKARTQQIRRLEPSRS